MSFLKNSEDFLIGEKIRLFAGGDIPLPEIYSSIDSTNIRAKVLAAEGAREGSAVLSDMQTAGHGRYGALSRIPPERI